MRRVLVAPCVVSVCCSIGIAAQELPHPNDPPPSQTITTTTTRGADVASGNLPDAGVARAMAVRVLASLDALTSRVQINLNKVRTLKQLVAQAEARVRETLAEKLRVLDEMRRGYYCSKCHRSKTEIEEQDHVDFMTHLREVNGQIVPAPQSELDAKAAEYDARISAAQQVEAAARAQRDLQVPQLEQENRDARDQIQQGIYLWESATSLEPGLLAVKQDEADRREKKSIVEAQSQLQNIQAERNRLSTANKLDPATAWALNDATAMWQSVMEKAKQDQSNGVIQLLHENQAAKDQKIKEYNLIGNYLSRTDEQSLANGAGGLQQLPTFNVSLAGVTANFTPEQMGIRFQFGSLSSSLQAQSTPTGYEVRVFLSLFGRLHAGMASVATFTPDGVELSDHPILKVGAPGNPKPTIVLPKPDLPSPSSQSLPKP